MTTNFSAVEIQALSNPSWRLHNLYHIIDKSGYTVLFKPNWAQQSLLDNMWYCNIILKARQLGLSTLVSVLFLDACLVRPNINAGIIAHTREDAEKLFRRVKFAHDHLPDKLKAQFPAVVDSARELKFSNGSTLQVGTSMRGSTLQYLHISEFGKICAHYPDKAREIVTGSLNTLAAGQLVFIESTAEGREGYFFEMCREAIRLEEVKAKLSKLEYRFNFFPWWKEPEYKSEVRGPLVLDQASEEYFNGLYLKGIALTDSQKAWYFSKLKVLGDDMLREFPSTAEESFASSNESFFYGRAISEMRRENRITGVPYQPYSLVHTAWDLGLDDYTAIWWFQLNMGGQIQVIDYYENHNEDPKHYVDIIRSKKYTYGTHILPHDAGNRNQITLEAYEDIVRPLLPGSLHIMEIDDKFNGIMQVKSALPRVVIDANRCATGIRHLENYKREWDAKLGCFKNREVHNDASHAADAFRMLVMGIKHIPGANQTIEGDYKALRNYFGTV